MSLKDVKGQQFAVKLLKRAVSSNRLAGTYLFYGPYGVGKEFTARQFAKLLNCTEKEADSCDRCSSCMKIDENKHPDVFWIYPVGKSRQIKIDQVRQLQKSISLMPFEGKYKICIILDAHTLNIESANALLKTLEEPPPNTVFILVTHSPETLLPTIKSRTQDIQFFYLPRDTIIELLKEKEGISEKEAVFCGKIAMGSIGRALGLVNGDIFNQRKFILDIMERGRFRDMGDLMDKVMELKGMLDKFTEDLESQIDSESGEGSDIQDTDAFVAGEHKRQVEEILSLILNWYRDILVYKNTQKEEMVINQDYIDSIKSWKDKFSIEQLCEKIKVIDQMREALSRQVNLKLILQVMFLKLGLI